MIRKMLRRLFPIVDVNSLKLDIFNNTQIQQRELFLYYQDLKNSNKQLPNFSDVGFRVYSQGDKDGKIIYFFHDWIFK